VYPNPASSELTLEFPAGFKSYQLTMFNSLGQQIHAEQLNDENAYSGTVQHKIDVSGFSKGIYILSLQTEYGNTFRRLIIQ
jgi:aminopeptidase YwaD